MNIFARKFYDKKGSAMIHLGDVKTVIVFEGKRVQFDQGEEPLIDIFYQDNTGFHKAIDLIDIEVL